MTDKKKTTAYNVGPSRLTDMPNTASHISNDRVIHAVGPTGKTADVKYNSDYDSQRLSAEAEAIKRVTS